MKGLLTILICFCGLIVFGQERINLTIGRYNQTISTDTNQLIGNTSESLTRFMIKGKDPFDKKLNRVGFIDIDGKVIIKPVYINCSDFHEGYALVENAFGNMGVIDRAGKIVIPLIYRTISRCKNGLFFARDGNYKLVLLSLDGRSLLPAGKYQSYATQPPPFFFPEGDDMPHNEFRWEPIYFAYKVEFTKFIGVLAGKKWAIIDSLGREVVPAKFDDLHVFNNYAAGAKIEGKYGVIDTTGQFVIPPIYDMTRVTGFKNAMVTLNNKVGASSFDNKLIVPVAYNYIYPFGSGFLVSVQASAGVTLFNNKGQKVAENSDQWRFHHPVLEIRIDGKISFIVYNKANDSYVTYDKVIDNEPSGVISYQKNGFLGLLSRNGDELTKPVFAEILNTTFNNPNVIKASYLNKWGLIDTLGHTLVPFEYDEIGALNKGGSESDILWLKKDEKYHLVTFNNSKLKKSENEYDQIDFEGILFKDYTYTIAVSIDKKWGFLDQNANELTPCLYDAYDRYYRFGSSATDFILPVKLKGKWGFLGAGHKPITAFIYDGQVNYRWYDNGGIFEQKHIFRVSVDGKMGLLSTSGKTILPCIYDYVEFSRHGIYNIAKDKKVGLINSSGKVIVAPYYDQIYSDDAIDRGHIWFWIIKNKKRGLMDSTGRVVIPCIYDAFFPERTGNIPAKINEKYGLLSFTGKQLIPFRYEFLDEMDWTTTSGKKVYYAILNGNAGLIDVKENIIMPFKYNRVSDTPSWGLFNAINIVDKEAYTGVVNLQGKVIIPLQYLQAYIHSDNIIVINRDGKYGLFDLKGQVIFPCIYSRITSGPNEKTQLILIKDKKISIVKNNGEYLFKDEFDKCEPLFGFGSPKGLVVYKGDKCGMLDENAQFVYPCIYKSIKYTDGKLVVETF